MCRYESPVDPLYASFPQSVLCCAICQGLTRYTVKTLNFIRGYQWVSKANLDYTVVILTT